MKLSRAVLRRLFAAVMLYGFAVGSALFWNSGAIDRVILGANLVAATLGLGFLHWRWQRQERKAMSPKAIRDVFS
jgi:hypothetical protein